MVVVILTSRSSPEGVDSATGEEERPGDIAGEERTCSLAST